jgi:SagB-type dehydrogenase family enzyme
MIRSAIRPPGLENNVTEGRPRKNLPQRFKGPVRPRFLQEAVVAPAKDGLVMDGTSQLQVIQGKATQRLIPRLIGLMDGSRTMKELEAALPEVPAEYVGAAVSLLARCGLVESGVINPEFSSLARPEPLAFFRRFVAATHANPSGRTAYDRLQAAEVAIVSPASTSAEAGILKTLLESSGLGNVILLPPESLSAMRPPEDAGVARLIVGFSFLGEDDRLFTELEEWCSSRRLSWIRMVVDKSGNWADVGPIFRSNQTPCYRCFRALHEIPSATAPLELSQAERQFWIGLLATEIIYSFNRIGPLISGRSFERYALDTWSSQSLNWARIPGCPRCLSLGQDGGGSRLAQEAQSAIETALVFEEYVGLRSREFSVTKTPLHTSMIMELARQTKRLPNSPASPLEGQMPKLESGTLDLLQSPPFKSGPVFTLKQLAALLMLTAGVRRTWSNEKQLKRWAPSAGNLGSPELFVVAREVEDLPAGFYFYQPGDHSLAQFRRRDGALPVEEFMMRVMPARAGDLPAALVLFTGAYHRVSQKYGPFAYRLINLDGGVALSQFQFVARGMGIWSEILPRWADDLIEEQCNLESMEEQSTAVAAIFTGDHPKNDSPRPPASVAPKNVETVRDFSQWPPEKLTEKLYHDSRIHEYDLGLAPGESPPVVSPWENTDGPQPAIALPLPAQGGRLAGEVLSLRASVRHFTRDSVHLQQLATMLHCAHYVDAERWTEEHRAGCPLTYLALAWNVEGTEPGVYRYDPGVHALKFLEPAPSPQQAAELFLQDEFHAVPLVVWISGNLAAACSRHGGFGHRQLLLRAGVAGHSLWTAAMGMGLSGSLISGLVPGAARRQFRLDGYHRASLLAIAAGHGIPAFNESAKQRPRAKKQ